MTSLSLSLKENSANWVKTTTNKTKQNKTATITFQQKYFFASNFNFSGCSHVCTLFTIKEQKKIGL